jgi:Phosphohistidine phosphatase SixA
MDATQNSREPNQSMPNVAPPTPRFELTLMRHAKALPAKAGESDHARGLDPLRGPFEAREAAIAAAGAGVRPQIALISTARRTVETWEAIAGVFPNCVPKFRDELYHAELPDLARLTNDVFKDFSHVMLIGHNPGIQAFGSQISTHATNRDSSSAWVDSNFPTAAIWSCHWADAGAEFYGATSFFSFRRDL